MTILLEVRNLIKYFPFNGGAIFRRHIGDIQAVDNISFSIRGGETFSLVGESGCGKSTTAKAILLLEKATAGSIYFEGKDITRLKGRKLRQWRPSVQSVFQDPTTSLQPRMRVRTIVAEPLLVNKALPKALIKERVDELLSMVGLDSSAANLFPYEFSGGQRQRIAIARALALKPKLIILDEPVSSLDVSIRAQILNLLKDLQQQLGVSYMLIAHDLATVRYMSNWLAVMYLGKIVEQGESEKIYSKPLHPYVQALLSAALPSHPDVVRQEIQLPGEVPSALNPPQGCRFHPRCFRTMPICSEVEPQTKEITPGHYVACHLFRD